MLQRSLLLSSLLLFVAFGVSASDTITPGLYKSTIRMEMTMGTMKMPERTMEREECITAEDVASGPPIPEPDEADCEVLKYEFGGGKIAMEMSCSMQGGQGRMVGTGTYTANSFEMQNHFKMQAAGVQMEMKSFVTAHRVKDC